MIVKSLHKVKCDLKRISNLIQIINNYSVERKYDLTKKIYFMLKCLNQEIPNEI